MRRVLLTLVIAMIIQTRMLDAQSAAPVPVLGAPRPWQRSEGAAFMAELRGLEGGKVILQSADGRAATLELAALSRVDRDYVRGKMGALAQRWLAQLAPAGKPAADRSGWPEIVRVPQESMRVTVKRAFEPGKGMRFASAHFEFESPAGLSPAEQRSVATPFELIHEVWRRAPWGVITPPKESGLFQVELFLQPGAYNASGAQPNSGCYFNYKTKELHVLGSAIGLDGNRDPLWRDEHLPVLALTYAMIPLLMQDLMVTLPEWLVPSLALAMRDLPLQGELAWPLELQKSLGEAMASTQMTDSEVRRFLNPSDKQADPPLSREKLRCMASYLVQGDGSNGGNLAAFLTAVSLDARKWDVFYQRIRERNELVKKSANDPSVVVPDIPTVPHDISDPAQVRWYHLAKLLGTTDAESGVRRAITTLKATTP